MSYHFFLIMSPLHPPMGFKYKMFFSVGPLSSVEVGSSSHIQILNIVSPLSPSCFNDLVQLQNFDLDFEFAIFKLAQKNVGKRNGD